MEPLILEKRVEILETLPARVSALEVQISEFRAEVRAEFSTLRQEMATKAEMRQLNAQTSAQMRMLHEEVLGRLALLAESNGRKRQARAPKT